MLPGLQVMYAISIIIILFVVAGLYGVCKRKKWMLICYIVGIILGTMFMCVIEIEGAALGPKLAQEIREHYMQLIPLTGANTSVIEALNDIQAELQCCGLDQGYQDWGYNISEACLCAEDADNPCVAAPRNSSLFQNVTSTEVDEPIMIYKEPCIAYLTAHATFAIHCLLGFIPGVLLLWILSVVLGIVILCQLNRKEDTPAVVYSPEAKAGNYSVLADDAEFT